MARTFSRRPIDTACKVHRPSHKIRLNTPMQEMLMFFGLVFFIYGHMASDIMVNDHSDSERGNPLSPHGILFPISSKGSFYKHYLTDRITHTTSFVATVVENWVEREIAPHGLLFPISSMIYFIRTIP